MQKITFRCYDCEAEGTVRLGDQFDDYKVEICPCCGTHLPLDDEEDDE